MKLISVALPVYNGADYLREALDSILGQEFEDFELVVSDNCSTDATPEILAEYAKRDARVKVFRPAAHLTQADNVNRAIELCSGDWVKLFCHDDLMHPQCLSTISEALHDPGCETVGLIGNGERHLFSNGYLYNSPSEKGAQAGFFGGRNFVKAQLLGTASACLPSLTTATVRKEAWSASTKFDGRFAHFDIFLWTRLLMEWDYLFVPAALTTNRIHTAQVAVSARKTLRSVEDYRIFYKEFLEQFEGQLGLSRRDRTKIGLKRFSVIGSTVAIELIKGKWSNALRLLSKVPARWWTFLPIFVVRSLYVERKRLMPVKNHVPLALIYPD